MNVELLSHMGSDLDVVNAARVSFAKHHETFSEGDAQLIQYLAEHQHWTPFSHCYAKFRIKAPIFVRAQLFKHKVGLTENEVSRRYVDSDPEFFFPQAWRRRSEHRKQGSSEDIVEVDEFVYRDVIRDTFLAYLDLLDAGVCPEQARMVLPQSMYTEWIWSGSLAAFARVYRLRTTEHAQKETREIAESLGDTLESLFPISWRALTRGR